MSPTNEKAIEGKKLTAGCLFTQLPLKHSYFVWNKLEKAEGKTGWAGDAPSKLLKAQGFRFLSSHFSQELHPRIILLNEPCGTLWGADLLFHFNHHHQPCSGERNSSLHGRKTCTSCWHLVLRDRLFISAAGARCAADEPIPTAPPEPAWPGWHQKTTSQWYCEGRKLFLLEIPWPAQEGQHRPSQQGQTGQQTPAVTLCLPSVWEKKLLDSRVIAPRAEQPPLLIHKLLGYPQRWRNSFSTPLCSEVHPDSKSHSMQTPFLPLISTGSPLFQTDCRNRREKGITCLHRDIYCIYWPKVSCLQTCASAPGQLPPALFTISLGNLRYKPGLIRFTSASWRVPFDGT